MKTVSIATILGFFITMLLLVCVSVLSLGVLPQAELATMKNPSMAAVLEYAVGPWGGMLINIGLILSVAGALLAWMLISSEMLYLAARGEQHTAPAYFGRLNAKGAPANALWLTNGLISLFLIINHLNNAGYNLLIQLASAMALIPYLLCAAFSLKLAWSSPSKCTGLIVTTALGTIYGGWLIYAGGMKFLLLSMVLYALGLPFYLRARHECHRSPFSGWSDVALAIIVTALAGVAIWSLS